MCEIFVQRNNEKISVSLVIFSSKAFLLFFNSFPLFPLQPPVAVTPVWVTAVGETWATCLLVALLMADLLRGVVTFH